MQAGDKVRIRIPSERSYRTVLLKEKQEDGWWDAWRESYGHMWGHQFRIHESWLRPRRK